MVFHDGGLSDHLVEGLPVVFDAFHRVGRERTFIHDLLLAHLAPARLNRGIVRVCGPAMDQVARADCALSPGS